MRLITFISVLILGFSCGSTKNITSDSYRKKSNKLNGTWVPVKQELGGVLLPAAVLEKQKLIIKGSDYAVISETTDKGLLKYGNDKMDIYGKEGPAAGKHITAIYKFVRSAPNGENGQLTICYNLSGDSYPETFETKGKPLYFLSVWKKN